MNFGFILPWDELLPWAIAAGVGVAVLFALLVWMEKGRGKKLSQFIEWHLASRLLLIADRKFRKPLFWFVVIGMAVWLVALAQPHFGETEYETSRRSRDVMVLLDVSESMRAEIPAPNRLFRSKQKVIGLMEKSFGDRFGLIVFSGAAQLMCPMTMDHGYYRTVLDAVDTDSISRKGTDIATALKLAIATFEDELDESNAETADSRAILLISDGEEVSGNAVDLAAAASKYARIYVIGVGDPRGTEVDLPRYYRNQKSSEKKHLSKLDESTLSKIALNGNGGYIRTSASNVDIDEISSLMAQLNTMDTTGDISERLMNRYQWPLSVAVAAFFLEGFWLVMLPRFRKAPEEYVPPAVKEGTHG
jgi:Ca-activated chloride channel family protein